VTVVRVRLIVGCPRDEIDAEEALDPIIAGAVNEAVWENDPDTADREITRIKEWFGGIYEWREVWASFDADTLADLFATATVEGTVEA